MDQTLNLQDFSSVLFQIVLSAFIVERALALLFEWDPWTYLSNKIPWLSAMKEVIAFFASYTICTTAHFDAIGKLFKTPFSDIGQLITALVIAGGSKGAIKLMQDVWQIKNLPNGEGNTPVPAAAPAQPPAPPASGSRQGTL